MEQAGTLLLPLLSAGLHKAGRWLWSPATWPAFVLPSKQLDRQSSPSVTGLESLTQKTPLLKTVRTRNH